MRGLEVGELRVGAGAYPAQMSVGQGDRTAGERAPAPAGRGDGRRPAGDDRRTAGRQARPRRWSSSRSSPASRGSPPKRCRRIRGASTAAPATRCSPTGTRPSSESSRFPLVGTRLPPRVAQDFLALAQGGHDRPGHRGLPAADQGRLDRGWRRTSCSPATRSRWRRWRSSPTRSLRESWLRSHARAVWMQTGYGFVYPRGTALSPAAEAFMAEVRGVEAEIAAAEKQASGARRAGSPAPRKRSPRR